jgi:hypothetical protein
VDYGNKQNKRYNKGCIAQTWEKAVCWLRTPVAIDTKQVLQPIRKLRKFLRNAPKHPNAEQVHRLRTNARRFESIARAFQVEGRKNEKKIQTELGKMRKRAVLWH